MKNIQNILIYSAAFSAALIVVIAVSYGGWCVKRHVNYSWNYQTRVQQEIDIKIKPLIERIDKLETELAELKKK